MVVEARRGKAAQVGAAKVDTPEAVGHFGFAGDGQLAETQFVTHALWRPRIFALFGHEDSPGLISVMILICEIKYIYDIS